MAGFQSSIKKISIFPRYLLATLVLISFAQGQAQAQEKPPVVFAAAEALGGLDVINQVENITLLGYGQWLYQFGGANITTSEHAPLKWNAANDMRKIYDLENDRFQQLERRNFLFPFAFSGGHNFSQQNMILDGDIAYDIGGGFAGGNAIRRVPHYTSNPQFVDGVYMRRMWMLNNPVVAVRTLLKEETLISNLRELETETLIDVRLTQGYEFSMAFEQESGLPSWIRWSHPQPNLGQLNLTTYFTGYVPFEDLLLPLGYNTEFDWREQDFFKIYVDNYIINGEIEDVSAPASVINSPELMLPPVPQITAAEAGDGVWRLSTGTMVFEFEDHLTLYELGNPNGLAVIEAARNLVPGKPVTEVIISHGHFDHTRGIRDAIAEGITVIGYKNTEGLIREMATSDAPDFPDHLELNPAPLNFIPVDEHLRLQDRQMTVDVYWGRANIHMADNLFAHVPDQKIFVEGDMATAAEEWQWWGDNYLDNIEHYNLEVDILAPVHMPIMTHEAAVQMVGEGVARARLLCAAELEKGNYFAGCPVQSERF